MHDWPLVHRYDGLWGRWAIAQCTMGSFGVVVVPPSFDDDLSFTQRVEDFAVEQFVSHPSIEAFGSTDAYASSINSLDLNANSLAHSKVATLHIETLGNCGSYGQIPKEGIREGRPGSYHRYRQYLPSLPMRAPRLRCQRRAKPYELTPKA